MIIARDFFGKDFYLHSVFCLLMGQGAGGAQRPSTEQGVGMDKERRGG